MPFNDRSRISPSIGAACGHVTEIVMACRFANAPQHALSRVLESMTLGRVQRARAPPAFVVALERALESVRRAAEEAAPRAGRARHGPPCRAASSRTPAQPLEIVRGAPLRIAEHDVRGVEQRDLVAAVIGAERALHERAIARVDDRGRRVGLDVQDAVVVGRGAHSANASKDRSPGKSTRSQSRRRVRFKIRTAPRALPMLRRGGIRRAGEQRAPVLERDRRRCWPSASRCAPASPRRAAPCRPASPRGASRGESSAFAPLISSAQLTTLPSSPVTSM